MNALHLAPENLLRASLVQNEQIVWLDRPKQGFVLRWTELLFLPLVAFMAIMSYGDFNPPTQLRPAAVSPGVVVLFVLALFVWLGPVRLWLDVRRRRGIAYAVTDRRVLIVDAKAQPPVWSAPLEHLRDVRLEEGFGTYGSIAFADFGDYDSFLLSGGNQPWTETTSGSDVRKRYPPMFELIRNPRQAYEAIKATAPRLTSP